MESAIKWYYKRIHVYDLSTWEKSVQQSERQIKCVKKENGMENKDNSLIKPKYVDVDLIRGSTFSKNKSQQNSLTVLFCGCFRILLFPFFTKWWVQQTNVYITIAMTILHLIYMSACIICAMTANDDLKYVTTEEVFLPYILMLGVGSIHCQISSTQDMNETNEKGEWEEISESSLTQDESETFVSLLDKTQSNPDLFWLPPIVVKEDMINVKIWQKGEVQKVSLSFVDIGSIIMRKAYLCNQNGTYNAGKALVFVCTYLTPMAFRYLHHGSNVHDVNSLFKLLYGGDSYKAYVVIVVTSFSRLIFTALLFVMLSTADRTFKKRLNYAKYFSYLTSYRRASSFGLPHFRLNKTKHIKAWICLRSYLQRRGPQRSADLIFSASYTCFMFLLCFVTVKMMGRYEDLTTCIFFWECVVWMIALAAFLLDYIITGAKILKKYNNGTVLLTEQFNVYMQIDRKPEKKEMLQRVNNALAVATKLIKETDTSSSSFGLTKNPIFYNLTRIILLSSFSSVVSELLGFKIKLGKLRNS